MFKSFLLEKGLLYESPFYAVKCRKVLTKDV
jgi:hypothetical protein